MKKLVLLFLNPILRFYRNKVAKHSHQRLDINRMEKKWALIEAELDGEKGSFLDIGCNEGFFTKYAAQKGWFSVGLDYNSRAIDYARQNTKDLDNVTFVAAPLSLELTKTFPTFDVIGLFSSFQEIYVALGRDEALACLGTLMEKCNSKILLEPASTNAKYHENLLKKDNDEEAIRAWVVSLFEDYPDWTIRKVGRTRYSNTEEYRYLYAIERKK